MLTKATVMSLLLAALLEAPCFAQGSILNGLFGSGTGNTTMGGLINGGNPLGGATNGILGSLFGTGPLGLGYDPASYLPFIDNNDQISGIYVDTADPNGNATFQGVRNGLPPTSMDSFVYEAGFNAELIYGDEGVNNTGIIGIGPIGIGPGGISLNSSSGGLPPYNGFTQAHRINNGITGRRDSGLTTGHGSYLPSAWGADEFLLTAEPWTKSGSLTYSIFGIPIPGLGTLGLGANGINLNTNGAGGLGNLTSGNNSSALNLAPSTGNSVDSGF